MEYLKELLSGNDPAREAKGNMAVINCTIVFMVCLLNRGLFSEYKGIFPETFSGELIHVISTFIIIHTACYALFRKIQLERLFHKIHNESSKEKENTMKMVGERAVIHESIKLSNQYLTENYTRPLTEKNNLFSCIFLIYLSYLELTGTSILIFITQNNLNNVIVLIALIILFANIVTKIKQFIWRTFTS